jgi:hypothetical protein
MKGLRGKRYRDASGAHPVYPIILPDHGGEMKLVSVNVSLPREVPFQGGMVKTGIFKEPVMGRVMLR